MLIYNNLKQPQNNLLPTSNPHLLYKPIMKPIKSVRNNELDQRRAKGLYFWCDERYVPSHKCRKKKLYSLCIVDGDGKEVDDDKNIVKEEPSLEQVTPHISINTLKGVTSFHTLGMIGKVDKHLFFLLL